MKRAKRIAHKFKVNGLMVRMVREHKGISQVELARMTKLNPRVLWTIETGRVRDPGISTVGVLAEALGLRFEQLILKVPDVPTS